MIKRISATAFEFNGDLVDVVALTYQNRKCGGARIHRVCNQLGVLAALADEVWRGMVVDEVEIGSLLRGVYAG